jgi:hypothetical protein
MPKIQSGDCVTFNASGAFGGFVVVDSAKKSPFHLRLIRTIANEPLGIEAFQRCEWLEAVYLITGGDVYNFRKSGIVPLVNCARFVEQYIPSRSLVKLMESCHFVGNISGSFEVVDGLYPGVPFGNFIFDRTIETHSTFMNRKDYLPVPNQGADKIWKYLVDGRKMTFLDVIENRLPENILNEAKNVERRMARMPELNDPNSIEEVKKWRSETAKIMRDMMKSGEWF